MVGVTDLTSALAGRKGLRLLQPVVRDSQIAASWKARKFRTARFHMTIFICGSRLSVRSKMSEKTQSASRTSAYRRWSGNVRLLSLNLKQTGISFLEYSIAAAIC